MAAKKEEKEYDILAHSLVPRHEIMKAEEVKELLAKCNVTLAQLPKIPTADPAVKAVGAKEGDVLAITRKSPTAGTTTYYRLVAKE